MTTKQTLFACATVFLFILGCTKPINYPVDIQDILNQSPQNRKELEATISHYSRNAKDSLKLQATYFIIRNLVGLKTRNVNTTDTDIYFSELNRIWQKDHKRMTFYIASNAIDSLNKTKGLTPSVPSLSTSNDLDVLSSEFLINNIDNAFFAWQHNAWSKGIPFAEFCEYILPYRCTNTYPQYDIRSYFTSKYSRLVDSMKASTNNFEVGKVVLNDVYSWFAEDAPLFRRYDYLRPTTFQNLLKSKIGGCLDATEMRVTALRSLGIPAVIDQIPNWGNNNSNHFWHKILDPAHDTIKNLITNTNQLLNTQYIIPGSSYELYPKMPLSVIPASVKRHYMRTVPKVYRQCFSRQLNSLKTIKADEDKIPAFFSNDRLKDVTHEYLVCADVNLKLRKPLVNEKYVYLCVFDNRKWKPVSWALIKNNTAEFKNMGKNIIYLPAYYRENEEVDMIPAGRPFLLTENGEIKETNPMKQTETVCLYTKYPYRRGVESWQGSMVGCKFQCANKADLSDSITVHTVKTIPFYQTYVPINEKKKFRYLYCQYKGLQKVSIAELEFLGKDINGKETKLTGKLIGNTGFHPNVAEKIIDGNRETYFYDKQDSTTYIGIDLGEGRTEQVSAIRFSARSDDNAVVHNVNFELFYWDNEWVSLGYSKGDSNNRAIFKNIPKQALLLLKSTEGGTESRIFTYEKGVQLFW